MKTIKRIFLIMPVLFLVLTCTKEEDSAKFILSISVTPLEGGSVSPDGGVFEEGTVVALQATPANGYLFKEWAGDLQNTDNPVMVTMGSDMNLTSVFVKSDIDGDGVTDDLDNCPDTPEGEQVNEQG
ncbi:MAG: thrombospondin type 3 repeat-containing protein, partial [Eudoraea sp.]|nr:thrombospondin type 3 repeat-containing protein [Eudoraea sp.]